MTNYLERLGRRMQAYSRRFGDPSGTLLIQTPHTLSRKPRNPFHVTKSASVQETVFRQVRGGWTSQDQPNFEGAGTLDLKDGKCTLEWAQYRITHLCLVALIEAPGAELFWDGVAIIPRSLLPDPYQGCTVLTFNKLREV
jgi:hypothetical protein